MANSTPAPRLAVLSTVWFEGSHADVIIPKIVDGWSLDGVRQEVELEVASMYIEQVGCVQGEDLCLDFLAEHDIPRALSIGEALAAGGLGVNVDGVLIIGEHGDYELNEHGQQIYPRRRFFDAAMAAMASANRFVPIFNDKGLAYSARDANEIVATAAHLGVELGAGSTIPISWRMPQGAEWPFGERIDMAVLVGWGPLERYGFHSLEGLQAHLERRSGGETGVSRVRGLSPAEAKVALGDGTIDASLVAQAMDRFELSALEREHALESVSGVIDIEYADGTRAFVVMCADELWQFGFACRGSAPDFSCLMWLPGPPHNHFGFLVRQLEQLVRDGRAAIPIARTQLTTGILDAAMRSWSTGVVIETPELDLGYQAPESVPGTGIALAMPEGWTMRG